MLDYASKGVRALSTTLAKGVLAEIDPRAVEHFERIERSVFEAAFGLPPDLEFSAAFLQAIAQALVEMPVEEILSARTPEELAEKVVKETLVRFGKRRGELECKEMKKGFEKFFCHRPSILDWILAVYLSWSRSFSSKMREEEMSQINRFERGVLKVIDHRGCISTGFALCDQGHVLTAEHVARDHDKIEVSFRCSPRELACWAQVIHSDQEEDIAILQISPLDWQALRRIGLTPLSLSLQWQPRDWVLCLGYQEQELFVDPLIVEAFIKPWDPVRTVLFRDGSQKERLVLVIPRDHPEIAPGISGGPVINLRNSRVMAMVTGTTREIWVKQKWLGEEVWECISPARYAFATPLSKVCESWPGFSGCCLTSE
ncbi:MAG: serine protease [Candidatus Hadarchaeum sp.]